MSTRFDDALAAIDAANADDPFTVTYAVDGVEVTRPKELAHSGLMCEWVKTLDPEAAHRATRRSRGIFEVAYRSA